MGCDAVGSLYVRVATQIKCNTYTTVQTQRDQSNCHQTLVRAFYHTTNTSSSSPLLPQNPTSPRFLPKQQLRNLLYHTHTYACTHTHICMHTQTYMHAHTHTYACTHRHICMHTHIYACTHTYMRAHTHIYICMHTHIHMHAHTHTYACTHRHICMHTQTYACTHTHMYACTHIHMHAHTHTHTYTNIRILFIVEEGCTWNQHVQSPSHTCRQLQHVD